MFQVRNPAIDGDDQWQRVRADTPEDAARIFRSRMKLDQCQIEVQNGDGVRSVWPQPKQHSHTGQMGKDADLIIAMLTKGMTINEILSDWYGPEVFQAFKRMLSIRGTVFEMARRGELRKDGKLYFKLEPLERTSKETK